MESDSAGPLLHSLHRKNIPVLGNRSSKRSKSSCAIREEDKQCHLDSKSWQSYLNREKVWSRQKPERPRFQRTVSEYSVLQCVSRLPPQSPFQAAFRAVPFFFGCQRSSALSRVFPLSAPLEALSKSLTLTSYLTLDLHLVILNAPSSLTEIKKPHL